MPENGRRRRLRNQNIGLHIRRNTARLMRIDRIMDATDERLERLAEEAGLTSLLLEDHKEHGGHG
jgi:hypothetical protein